MEESYERRAMPAAFVDRRRADGQGFYCPSGHSLSYGDSDLKKARRERDQALERVRVARARAEWAEKNARGARISAGKAKQVRQRWDNSLSQFGEW